MWTVDDLFQALVEVAEQAVTGPFGWKVEAGDGSIVLTVSMDVIWVRRVWSYDELRWLKISPKWVFLKAVEEAKKEIAEAVENARKGLVEA